MIIASVAQLDAHLKQNMPQAVLIVADQFTTCQSLACIKSAASDREIITKKNSSGVQELLFSQSLFQEKRVLVLEAVDGWKEGESTECIKQLTVYLNRPDPAMTVVCCAETVKANSPLYLAFTAHCIVQVAKDPPWEKEAKIAAWIQSFCKARSVQIDPKQCVRLAKAANNSYLVLTQELEKLLTYIGDEKTITARHIEAICALGEQNTLWQLSDAILQADIKQALILFKSIEQQSLYSLIVVRHLRNSVRDLLQIASMASSGQDIGKISEHFPKMKGRLFEKANNRAQFIGTAKLIRLLQLVDGAESQLKDSTVDETTLIQTLILKLNNALLTA